jgi:hypothetical protein
MSGHEILGRARADRGGVLSTTIAVPETAAPGPHFFLVTDEQDQPLAISNVFVVTAPDRSLTVRGRVSDEGVECTALRGEQGELYTLAGELGDVRPGDALEVEGTLAEVSFCQQGITIDVRAVRPRP